MLELFADLPGDRLMIQATSGMYRPGARTGLTMGDLRELSAELCGRAMEGPEDQENAGSKEPAVPAPLSAEAAERWHRDRVRLWQNLRDALNALELAGERPGLDLTEADGRMVRHVCGETARVSHADDDPVWRLEVATDL
ncbi:hypothetical protein ACH4OW_26150 [Streptomyces sp. NPDC017056]|uniref:hypothetical protein n=1 Tax=Streptomyces sp. NPDC017056 TaxID=3364973 RepID=UPI003788A0E9